MVTCMAFWFLLICLILIFFPSAAISFDIFVTLYACEYNLSPQEGTMTVTQGEAQKVRPCPFCSGQTKMLTWLAVLKANSESACLSSLVTCEEFSLFHFPDRESEFQTQKVIKKIQALVSLNISFLLEENASINKIKIDLQIFLYNGAIKIENGAWECSV